ncbi:ABC transporter permease [Phycisphaerae bacterium]|jgi:putative ABC transport system permease protein|nr:ABC transporter permease [Phycisphaerae bacterium]
MVDFALEHMFRIALRMLFGDRTKYVTLVLGLAFAALLMNQQGAIFLGLLRLATGPLQNVTQNDLWVTDPDTPWIAEFRALPDQKLARVRSVAGVAWAEPFFNGIAVCELASGTFKRVQIIGISRSTLAGGPPEMIEGRIEDLWIPDAIVVERKSLERLGGAKVGDVLKINDRRAVIVGVCKAKLGFEGNAVIYTTFDNATRFTPTGRERISYVLVKVKDGIPVQTVKEAIKALGDVDAFTSDEFRLKTKAFIVVATGIGINFAVTIVLGLVVGLLLSASIFYQFTVENLRYFAVLKAMGARTPTLTGMILIQAIVVGVIGFGIGGGVAGMFAMVLNKAESELQAEFPWWLYVGSFVATIITIMLASLISVRRVVGVSPGQVFAS